MRLRFTARSLKHLDNIRSYLDDRNPGAARRVTAKIRTTALSLLAFPSMARQGTVARTREWTVRGTPYILIYRLDEAAAEVVILAIMHGAQNRGADEA